MAHSTILRIACAALLLSACDNTTTDLPPNATTVNAQRIDRIAQDYYSGLTQRSRQVIRTAADWNTFWLQFEANKEPKSSPPVIDFSQEMVVIAAMGQQPTGGYAIQIENVAEAEGRTYVVVREFSPGEGCGVNQVITAPVDAVRVRAHAGSVSFVERKESRVCSAY